MDVLLTYKTGTEVRMFLPVILWIRRQTTKIGVKDVCKEMYVRQLCALARRKMRFTFAEAFFKQKRA